MQTVGYIIDKKNNEKIKLLIRRGRTLDKFCWVVKLKMRKSGSDGYHLEAEEEYLNQDYSLIEALKNGENVNC